jgi:hypothetical protein
MQRVHRGTRMHSFHAKLRFEADFVHPLLLLLLLLPPGQHAHHRLGG